MDSSLLDPRTSVLYNEVRQHQAAVTHPTSEPQASIVDFDDMSHRSMRYESSKRKKPIIKGYIMSQKYELIHSASYTSSLFMYCKDIRSSSLRGTNISSSPKSGSLIPDYPIPIPYSRIRSSQNPAIFYSKLFGKIRISPEGGIEPDLNGFSDSTIVIAPLVPFDPDSFRLCTAVSLRLSGRVALR